MSDVVRSHDAALHRPSFLQVDDKVVKKLDGKQEHLEWLLLRFSIRRCSHPFIEGSALFLCPSSMISSTSFSARRTDMASSTGSISMERSSGDYRTAELVKRRPFFRFFMTLLYIHQIDMTFLNRSLTFIIGNLFDQFSRRDP